MQYFYKNAKLQILRIKTNNLTRISNYPESMLMYIIFVSNVYLNIVDAIDIIQ